MLGKRSALSGTGRFSGRASRNGFAQVCSRPPMPLWLLRGSVLAVSAQCAKQAPVYVHNPSGYSDTRPFEEVKSFVHLFSQREPVMFSMDSLRCRELSDSQLAAGVADPASVLGFRV